MSTIFEQLSENNLDYFVSKTKEKYNIQELENQEMYSIRDLELYVEGPEGKVLVTHVIKKTLPSALIEFDDNIWIDCSKSHWIKTINRGCVAAQDLLEDDIIETSFGTTSIKSVILNDEVKDFYDISVESNSKLFYTANGICHHNTGKTQTVETELAKAGLTDGGGYFKNTGSASPIGIYTSLYDNRNSIVLFDDCDSALADQEGRNLIKAATDTKKVRKVAWNKKSSVIIPKDQYESAEESADGDRPTTKDGSYLYPNSFEFTGRIIFISNLKIDKLDPDGAIRTRGFIIEIDPTDSEMIDYMAKIAPMIRLEGGVTLKQSEINEVIEEIRKSPKKSDISLRKLVRGLNVKAEMGDDPMWKNILKLYA